MIDLKACSTQRKIFCLDSEPAAWTTKETSGLFQVSAASHSHLLLPETRYPQEAYRWHGSSYHRTQTANLTCTAIGGVEG